MVLARPDERVVCPYHFSFCCRMMVRRKKEGQKPLRQITYRETQRQERKEREGGWRRSNEAVASAGTGRDYFNTCNSFAPTRYLVGSKMSRYVISLNDHLWDGKSGPKASLSRFVFESGRSYGKGDEMAPPSEKWAASTSLKIGSRVPISMLGVHL
ncbi:hypothetical protein PoB_001287700 [Plakobranchus ocellatus]|uniref:Uncharacterized protein n=1 Tax=Plakobranchus ocellatus TaxID=259542 RepID=A0AAV3YTU6_9GAST|nr:hypothetical protein PoB_001287700 [Plakobranchus ocellatus]